MRFQNGDKVKVIAVVKDSDKRMGEIGIVRRVNDMYSSGDYDYSVDFPNHPGWGIDDEALRGVTEATWNKMKLKCRVCSKEVIRIEIEHDYASGEDLCKECHTMLRKCRNCGVWVKKETIKQTEDGFDYCLSCFSSESWKCAKCEGVYSHHTDQYNVRIDGGENEVCGNCYDEHFHKCHSCCASFESDVLIFDEETDNYYCRRCDESRIHPREAQHRVISTKIKGEYLKINRAVGVEIEAECGTPKFLNTLPAKCGVEHDGSLDRTGVEVQTPPATMAEAEKLIRATCETMKAAGYMGTKHCGLHVHLDAGDFRHHPIKLAHVLRTVYAVEDLLYSMMPPSRWENQYCRKLSKYYKFDDFAGRMTENKFECKWYRTVDRGYIDRWKGQKHDGNETRYCGLNLHTTMYRGTVEFRMHSGTVNPIKILRWTALLLNIVDYAVKRYNDAEIKALYAAPTTKDKLKVFFKAFKVSSEIKKYILLRIKKFNPKFAWKYTECEEENLNIEAEPIVEPQIMFTSPS